MSKFERKWTAGVLLVVLVAVCSSEKVKFQVSHCNDLSGQLESFKPEPPYSSRAPEPCTCTSETCDCVGGLKFVVNHLHAKVPGHEVIDHADANVLVLTAGNLIGGESGWVPSMGEGAWKKFGDLVKNYIKPTAAAFGVKEFGAGISQTVDFLSTTGSSSWSKDTFTLVNSCSGNEEESFCKLIEAGVITHNIIDAGGVSHKIGIVGFTNPDAEKLSLPGKLKFTDIVTSIKDAVAKLNDVKAVIAIGDGSLTTAQQIIDAVPKVKMVLFASGFSSGTDITGSYPRIYNDKIIATAGRYGSSVGKMVLEYDTESGAVTHVKADLVPTNYLISVVPGVDLKEWETAVEKAKNSDMSLVGRTHVKLSGGEPCWRRECNLGNLMTDAVVHCVLKQLNGSEPLKIPLHSIWHGGAFFEDIINSGSNITVFDLHKWLPYHNRVHLVQVSGSNLRKVFEISATGIDPKASGKKDWRHFLQVSNGFEVYYETKPGPPKVTKIRMNHDMDGVPMVKDINDTHPYYLAIPTFLYEMRGYYHFDTNIWTPVTLGGISNSSAGFDDDCLKDYITALDVVSVGLEERIFIDVQSGGGGGGGGGGSGGGGDIPDQHKHQKPAVTVILTIVFYSIFLATIFIGYFFVLPRLRRPNTRELYPPNQL